MAQTLLEIGDEVGMKIENAIRLKILSNVPPPLKEATIKRKGSSQTLIDSGQMLASISHSINDSNPELFQIWAGIFEEDIAEYAVSHEYGREDAGIPCRSFIRSTYDEIFDNELMPEIVDRLAEISKERLGK